jgi:poly(rC)-binding protein 3/4
MSHHSIVPTQVNQPPSVVEYILPVKRDSLYLEREPLADHSIHRSGVSLYGRDPALSILRPSGLMVPALYLLRSGLFQLSMHLHFFA